MSKQRLGELLLQQGIIDANQLQAALGHQKKWGGRVGEILIELGFSTESSICDGLSKALRLPLINLTQIESSSITRELLVTIPLTIAREHMIVPLSIREIRGRKRLIIATADPTNYKIFDEIQFKSSLPLLVMIAPRSDIQWFIQYYYLGENNALALNYISVISQKGSSYTPEKLSVEQLSSIFDDSNFTKLTRAYRDLPKKDSES